MILKKPFTYSFQLREKISEKIDFKLVINQEMRNYSKNPLGESISFEKLVEFIKINKNKKREKIPENQYYLKHVRNYWTQYPKGNFKEMIKNWRPIKI